MADIVVWRDGRVEIVEHIPDGLFSLAAGERDDLSAVLNVAAQRAADGVTLVVPGVAGVEDDLDALIAVGEFIDQLRALLAAEGEPIHVTYNVTDGGGPCD